MQGRILYAEARCADGRWVRAVREDGSAFVAEASSLPPGVEIRSYTPDPEPVPDFITARQARLWLVRNGYRTEQVEAVIASLPEPERSEAKIEWEYASEFSRKNPILKEMFRLLARLEKEQVDAALERVFREAAKY